MHCTTYYPPFKVVYSFNPLTPLELISLFIDEKVNLDDNQKADVVKDLQHRYGNR